MSSVSGTFNALVNMFRQPNFAPDPPTIVLSGLIPQNSSTVTYTFTAGQLKVGDILVFCIRAGAVTTVSNLNGFTQIQNQNGQCVMWYIVITNAATLTYTINFTSTSSRVNAFAVIRNAVGVLNQNVGLAAGAVGTLVMPSLSHTQGNLSIVWYSGYGSNSALPMTVNNGYTQLLVQLPLALCYKWYPANTTESVTVTVAGPPSAGMRGVQCDFQRFS
jgi:hypothetical protein